MRNVIFVAPPAAGKGTQSKLICMKYNLIHISTGDLLRSASLKEDELGLYIKKQIKEGHLVSDSIMIELLKREIDWNCNGYLIDGFPRNVSQAKQLDELFKQNQQLLTDILYLDIPKEEAKKRIIGRISCPNCGAVYNDMIEENKPKQNDICDDCQHSLIKREDDNETSFEKRYQVYLEQTYPLIDYYQGRVKRIDAIQAKEKIFKQICTILDGEQ